jgi:hypothetical protein
MFWITAHHCLEVSDSGSLLFLSTLFSNGMTFWNATSGEWKVIKKRQKCVAWMWAFHTLTCPHTFTLTHSHTHTHTHTYLYRNTNTHTSWHTNSHTQTHTLKQNPRNKHKALVESCSSVFMHVLKKYYRVFTNRGGRWQQER